MLALLLFLPQPHLPRPRPDCRLGPAQQVGEVAVGYPAVLLGEDAVLRLRPPRAAVVEVFLGGGHVVFVVAEVQPLLQGFILHGPLHGLPVQEFLPYRHESVPHGHDVQAVLPHLVAQYRAGQVGEVAPYAPDRDGETLCQLRGVAQPDVVVQELAEALGFLHQLLGELVGQQEVRPHAVQVLVVLAHLVAQGEPQLREVHRHIVHHPPDDALPRVPHAVDACHAEELLPQPVAALHRLAYVSLHLLAVQAGILRQAVVERQHRILRGHGRRAEHIKQHRGGVFYLDRACHPDGCAEAEILPAYHAVLAHLPHLFRVIGTHYHGRASFPSPYTAR